MLKEHTLQQQTDIQLLAQHVLLVISAHTLEPVLHSSVVLDSFLDLALHNVTVAILATFATQQQPLKLIWKQTPVQVKSV